MQPARVDVPPAIPKSVAFKVTEVEILIAIPLKRRHVVVAAFKQKVNGFAAKLCGVETVEQQRTPATLRVPDLARENHLTRGFAATQILEVFVPDTFD